MATMQNKYRGCFVGLAIGDTLGMSVEFMHPGEFEPLTKPEAGGPFNLPLGYWTDDTSMALCLADSLIENQGYDSYDVMDKYFAWRLDGYRSSTGKCFDIGNQVSTSLNDYMFETSSVIPVDKERLSSAGNGSIMRLAPIAIASHASGQLLEECMELSRISGRETHYSSEAETGTAIFGALLYNALSSADKSSLFEYGNYPKSRAFESIAATVSNASKQSASTIDPTGYIVNSLLAAVWAFMNYDTFESGALAAVNLGGDADTIGAIYGQLAGAFYGYEAIPKSWRSILYMEKEIVILTDKLIALDSCPVITTRFEEDGPNYTRQTTVTAHQGDITLMSVDAVVNAANTELRGGGGVCGAIFNAAGYEEMAAACSKLGNCDYGDAVVTPGFNLKAKWVIHTVGPVYGQHGGNEADILASCYWQSLRLAANKNLWSIAFPLISAGIYGYPKQEAIHVAVDSIKTFFVDNPRTSIKSVIICGYDERDAAEIIRAV